MLPKNDIFGFLKISKFLKNDAGFFKFYQRIWFPTHSPFQVEFFQYNQYWARKVKK